jgi:hypothetical protein
VSASALIIAQIIVWIAAAYAGIGFLFAVLFVWKGVERLDPSAQGTGLGFRLLILPGAVILWPLLAYRIFSGQHQPPAECNTHRRLSGNTTKENQKAKIIQVN